MLGDDNSIGDGPGNSIGEDAPGSYYPVPLELPEPGAWLLTVAAGDDQVIIPIDVTPAES